ncbi:MAG: permease [Treponema sp.]|jgi:putative hydroxymethylpyrimidine transporter CytX|nr:permease [Treponema sp.]
MKKQRMFLLWLGAAISLSEIFTGGMLAPLGFAKGLTAIILGHLIGTGFLAVAGYVSFTRKQNAMDSAVYSFGSGGGKLIALCNVVQLIGWSIIMVIQAGSAITGILPELPFTPVALILSILVVLWAFLFGSPIGERLHVIVVVLLSLLCVVLFMEAAGGSASAVLSEGMSMTLAVELSITMPVSWLPLVGDYACDADGKWCAAGMPFAGYFIGSVVMYVLGLFIGITRGSDIFTFIAASPFRIIACAVVLLSTLTTAFLDLYSALISSRQFITPKNKSLPLIIAGGFTVAVSALFPPEGYEAFLTEFLMVIGTVFVPVYAVLFMDFLTKAPKAQRAFPAGKLIIAAAGMAAYQLLTRYELWIPTLLSMALVCVLYIFFYQVKYTRSIQYERTSESPSSPDR